MAGLCGSGAQEFGERMACLAEAAREAATQPVMSLVLLAAASLVALLLLYWVQYRLRRYGRNLARTARLLCSRQGRVLLGMARRIRNRAERVTATLQLEMEDKGERRALQTQLRRFVREDLEFALDQGRALIALSDDREAARLHMQLEMQIHRWNGLPDGPERDRLQAETATTRHRLARQRKLNEDRADLTQKLEDIADAMRMLEEELTGLRVVRRQDLPRFGRQLRDTAEQLHHLRQAYQELEAPHRG